MDFPGLRMSPTTIRIVLAIVILGILAFLWFSKIPEIVNFRSSLSEWLERQREALVPLWKAWCWIYIIPWRMWFRLRHAAVQTLILIITAVSFFVVGESSLVLLHHQELAKHVPWISEAALERLPHLPLWADISAVGLAILLSWHHVREWKAGQRKEQLPQALEELLRRFGQSEKKTPLLGKKEKEVLFESLMTDFRKVLELRRKKKISASLMEETSGGELGVTFTHQGDSNDKFNKNLSLEKGQGGAGIAYAGPISVYIPSVRHLVAIDAQTIKPVGLYERQEPKEPFRSLLCIPVLGKAKVVAVLTFASRKRNAFSPADYQIMRLAAVFVSFFFD
jgi:hypothetical protein